MFIPFKIPLGHHKIQPTSRLQVSNILFTVSYYLKVRFQEESGKAWVKEIRINIGREK